MREVKERFTAELSRDALWNFVRDINAWAPMLKGYQSHEIINERESFWLIKGEFASFSRVTRFHVHITEWIEGERLAFTLKGVNESVDACGRVELKDLESGTGTEIAAEMGYEIGGVLGVILNRLVEPWVKSIAKDLLENIVCAVGSAEPQTSNLSHHI